MARRIVLLLSAALLATVVVATPADAAGTRTYYYAFERRGTTYADFAEFQRAARATLSDGRGWWRGGVRFVHDPGRADFSVVLASPAAVERASSVCSAQYSCRVGDDVLINDDRWRFGASPFRASLGDYRRYVVQHEVGHWLGQGHPGCSALGAPAPIMQQQSKGMQGCLENWWPLASEVAQVAARHGTAVRARTLAVVGDDGQVWLQRSGTPYWHPLGGQLLDAPSVVPTPGGLLVLGRGGDGNVWIRSLTTGWQPFLPAGSVCHGPSAAAVSRSLVVACRGADRALWVARADLPRSSTDPLPVALTHRSLGGSLAHGATVGAYVTADGRTRPRYVAVGGDGQPWARTDADPWSAVGGGGTCGDDVAVSPRLEAMACRDRDTAALRVWHRTSGSAGAVVGGRVRGRPGLRIESDGATAVDVVGGDGGVWSLVVLPDGRTTAFDRTDGSGRYGVASATSAPG